MDFWKLCKKEGNVVKMRDPEFADGIWMQCPSRVDEDELCQGDFRAKTGDSKFCRLCGLRREHDKPDFTR